MNSAEGVVAGVPSILLRIGFVGETGWEIHFPAEYGEYFWGALMEAGKELGVKSFGVEAQRVLRLDKKHVIVSQDTDALSDPFEADMSWIVKFEKDDFVGKAALTAIKETGTKRTLVGFVMDSVIVHDGDQVYTPEGDRLIGVVTSARFSPSVGKCVGLAIVSFGSAKDEGPLKIMTMGKLNQARVTLRPFYDPEGKRLKS
jgi:sarcosine oxidase subunit alpha